MPGLSKGGREERGEGEGEGSFVGGTSIYGLDL